MTFAEKYCAVMEFKRTVDQINAVTEYLDGKFSHVLPNHPLIILIDARWKACAEAHKLHPKGINASKDIEEFKKEMSQ